MAEFERGAARKADLGPAPARERLAALDGLRGFALLGILLVNVGLFSGPEFWLQIGGMGGYSGLDAALNFLVTFLFQAKFYSIFSFLFGMGLVMQTMRAEARGVASGGFLARRLAVLAVFGAIHAVFIWSGDILLTYALLGFLFLLFRKRRPRTMLVWAAILIFLPGFLLLVLGTISLLATTTPEGARAITQAGAGQADLIRSVADSALAAYGSGSYADMVAQRLSELYLFATNIFFIAPGIFGMFLIGGAVARAGWLEDIEAHRAGIRRAVTVGLAVGLPLNLLAAYGIVMNTGGAVGTAMLWIGQSAQLLGAPFLALAYAGIVATMIRRFPGSDLARRTAAVGRMALTNYLLQSVVMTSIFYGLGLYGRVSFAVALLMCLVLYAAQLFLSPLWLSRFSQGPMEWLWRRLTYSHGARTTA